MSTALQVKTWEDEFYELMDSVSTTYWDTDDYINGVSEVVEKVNNLALNCYDCIAGFYTCSELKHPYVPYIDDIFFNHEQHVFEVINEAVSIYVDNDAEYRKIALEQGEQEAYDRCESCIVDQYLNSGSCDMAAVYLALKSMGFNYLVLPESESINSDLPPNVALSVGDAQNVLFPALVEKAQQKFCEMIALRSNDDYSGAGGTVMAIRYDSNGERIGIGGEVKWN